MLIVLCGPTGTGKSDVALELAQHIGGEIVSADSMLVYRGMDLGTAKPTREQRECVAHHLIDLVEPTEDYNVARYQRESRAAIDDILARGRPPLLVGGTGFYIRALIDDAEFPDNAPPAAELRARLKQQARDEGAGALHARLAELDPASARRIHPHNVKRVMRALEIVLQTGAPVPTTVTSRVPAAPTSRYTPLHLFGLTRERKGLYRHLDERVDRMMAAGFVEEVRALRQNGVRPSHLSQQALGYRQIHGYLDGELTLDEAVAKWKPGTRQFAKRQWTWFNADPRIAWIDVDELESPLVVAQFIARHLVED